MLEELQSSVSLKRLFYLPFAFLFTVWRDELCEAMRRFIVNEKTIVYIDSSLEPHTAYDPLLQLTAYSLKCVKTLVGHIINDRLSRGDEGRQGWRKAMPTTRRAKGEEATKQRPPHLVALLENTLWIC